MSNAADALPKLARNERHSVQVVVDRLKVRPDAKQRLAESFETALRHAFIMDGAPEGGGRNLGPRPMETVLAGTGGCTAYDVVAILQRSGQAVTGCELNLTSERAATDPKVFTHIAMRYVVTGVGLDRAGLDWELTC